MKRGLGVEAGAGVERREGGLVGGLEVDIVERGWRGGRCGGYEILYGVFCKVWMEFGGRRAGNGVGLSMARVDCKRQLCKSYNGSCFE